MKPSFFGCIYYLIFYLPNNILWIHKKKEFGQTEINSDSTFKKYACCKMKKQAKNHGRLIVHPRKPGKSEEDVKQVSNFNRSSLWAHLKILPSLKILGNFSLFAKKLVRALNRRSINVSKLKHKMFMLWRLLKKRIWN